MRWCSQGVSASPRNTCCCYESVLIDGLNLRMRWWSHRISCGLGGFHLITSVSGCMIVAKEPHFCFNRRFLCSLSRQQALFHVLAAYSVYNTVSLFVYEYRCGSYIMWRSLVQNNSGVTAASPLSPLGCAQQRTGQALQTHPASVLFRAFRWDLLFMSVAVTECTAAHCNRQTTSEPSQHSQVPLWHYALINGQGNGPPQVRVSFLLTAKSSSFILFIVINIHFLIMCLKMHFWMMLSHIKMTRCIFIKVPLSSSVASPPEFVSVGWNQVFTTK